MTLLLYYKTFLEEYKYDLEPSRVIESGNKKTEAQAVVNSFLDDNRPVSEVLSISEINNASLAKNYICQVALTNYKKVSEVINNVESNKRPVRKKTMKQLMQESVFHGAKWIGSSNFIA